MSTPPSPPSASQFFTIAVDLKFLSGESAASLTEQAKLENRSASELAHESGELDFEQIDIVRSLLAPREIIPGHHIKSLLGRGGMGVVYRAEQLNLGREVAIKTILVSRMSDKNSLNRFEREAKTIGQLRHPNIVSAFDFGRHAGRLYLSLELVEGIDLDAKISQSGPLDEFLTLQIMRQSAAGLAHAAQHQIVHRDIKPANLILVDPPEGYPLDAGVPMVKIADFGLALLQSDLGDNTRLTSETTLGTPYYMAPEQLESSDVDLRADIYSLGASAVNMLVGQPPFHGLKMAQIVTTKFTGDQVSIGKLPENLSTRTRQLILRMMARDLNTRPQNYQELIREIDSILPTLNPELLETAVGLEQVKASVEVTSTIEFSRKHPVADEPSSRGKPRLRNVVYWLVGLGTLATVGIITAAFLPLETPQADQPPQRNLLARPVSQSQQLFNGKDTGGWTVDHGSWIWSSSKTALEGTDGLIRRPIPGPALNTSSKQQRLLWYRLELILGSFPESAASTDAQELHFGISNANAPVCVLRRTGSGLSLETLANDPQVPPLEIPAESMVAVTLDRLPAGWFLEINGNPYAAFPRQQQELPEFQLRAIGGPVYFSDAVISEMSVEPKSQATSR